VNYRLYFQGSPTGNAVSGNGGTINLISGNLTVSGTVRVLATRNSLPVCEKYLNDSIAITIINPAAPIINTSGTPPFCEGKIMTLQSSYTSNILWSTGAVTSAISVNASGNYTVTYTDNMGCTSSTVKVVSMFPNPVQPVISGPSPVGYCYGNNIVLSTANVAGLQYQWRKFGNNIPGATTTNYTLTTPGKYRIRVTDNNGCTAISNFYEVIAGPDKPVIAANTSLTICPGGNVVLSTSPLAGLTYTWRNYAINIPGALTNQYAASAGGSYTCVATNSYGCTHASDPVVVSVSPSKPILNYSGTVGMCAGASILLAAAPQPNVEYQWKKYSNLIPGATDPSLTVTSVGSYKCIASDGNGCTRVSDAVNVIVNCKVDNSTAGENFVNIYPNPSPRNFTISSNLPITEIKIFDMKGIKVNATFTEMENGTYDISGLTGGIYTAIIDTGESSSIKRLVVMKNN